MDPVGPELWATPWKTEQYVRIASKNEPDPSAHPTRRARAPPSTLARGVQNARVALHACLNMTSSTHACARLSDAFQMPMEHLLHGLVSGIHREHRTALMVAWKGADVIA